MEDRPTVKPKPLAGLRDQISVRLPGLLVACLVAIAGEFLSDNYGAPAMLMALLLGMTLHFLAEEGRCAAGIDLAAKAVLRVGVALLGARISFELFLGLGSEVVALVVLAVVFTIGSGLVGARLLGRGWRLGILTGGAVAICGASAAMAIAAVLPKNEFSERNLIFTVLGVTVLSTVALLAYPIIALGLDLNDTSTGVFLGAAIHDVAQVVGAGFSVSDPVGETATVVKLIRVAMLAPTVIALALIFRATGMDGDGGSERPPLVPLFLLGFIGLATLRSFDLIPTSVSTALSEGSRWALLVSIGAVGMKTSLRRILDVGGQALILIVGETVFLATLVLAILVWMR